MIRTYHTNHNKTNQHNKIITTIFSHPSNTTYTKITKYKIITLYPNTNNYPNLNTLKTTISNHTTALIITNPKNTNIFNPHITKFIDTIHTINKLTTYNQTNTNKILKITHTHNTNFNLYHFNLHKTFSTPHAYKNPTTKTNTITKHLIPFLPNPLIERDNNHFFLNHNQPQSINKITHQTPTTNNQSNQLNPTTKLQTLLLQHHTRAIPQQNKNTTSNHTTAPNNHKLHKPIPKAKLLKLHHQQKPHNQQHLPQSNQPPNTHSHNPKLQINTLTQKQSTLTTTQTNHQHHKLTQNKHTQTTKHNTSTQPTNPNPQIKQHHILPITTNKIQTQTIPQHNPQPPKSTKPHLPQIPNPKPQATYPHHHQKQPNNITNHPHHKLKLLIKPKHTQLTTLTTTQLTKPNPHLTPNPIQTQHHNQHHPNQ